MIFVLKVIEISIILFSDNPTNTGLLNPNLSEIDHKNGLTRNTTQVDTNIIFATSSSKSPI